MVSFLDWTPTWVSRKMFKDGLLNPNEFARIRQWAYFVSKNDSEKVHELALQILSDYTDIAEELSPRFKDIFPNLKVPLFGQNVLPIGPAEGLDKNAVALYSLSKFFGFVFWGTEVVNPRDGNQRPRVYADESNKEAYNAQGFPSLGLNVGVKNLRGYRKKYEELGENAPPIGSSICGIPSQDENIAISLEIASKELEMLATELGLLSDVIIWNPYSPNTKSLEQLRTEESFRENPGLIRKIVGRDKPILLKVGPYDDDKIKRRSALSLVNAFLEGGGNGVVAVNTYMVQRENIPAPNWGYSSAGRSGGFLVDYRQRAIKDAREAFGKDVIIIGAGGTDRGNVFSAFEAGANAVVSYTSHMFNGFGIVPEMLGEIDRGLKSKGYETLEQFQRDGGFVK